jgi:hypothetical protein
MKNKNYIKFNLIQFRNDAKKLHNCLCQFEMLPRDEKLYDTNLAMETLK